MFTLITCDELQKISSLIIEKTDLRREAIAILYVAINSKDEVTAVCLFIFVFVCLFVCLVAWLFEYFSCSEEKGSKRSRMGSPS